MTEILLSGLVAAVLATYGAHVLERRRLQISAARAVRYRLLDQLATLRGMRQALDDVWKTEPDMVAWVPWRPVRVHHSSQEQWITGTLPTWLCDYIAAAERMMEVVALHFERLQEVRQGKSITGAPASPLRQIPALLNNWKIQLDERLPVASSHLDEAVNRLEEYCEEVRRWTPMDDEVPPCGIKPIRVLYSERSELWPPHWGAPPR